MKKTLSKNTILTGLILLILFCADNVNATESTNTESINNDSLYERIKGKIVLKVEENGEAYYVHPSKKEMYFLSRPVDAFKVLREQGIGITNSDLEKIETGDINVDNLLLLTKEKAGVRSVLDSSFAKKHIGKIFLQVEENGEAWYIHSDAKRYFLGKPISVFNVMRKMGVGVSNGDFEKMKEFDWKIYKNNKYGFEFRYLSNWKVEEVRSEIRLLDGNDYFVEGSKIPPISVSVSGIKDGFNIEDWKKIKLEKSVDVEVKEFVVDGINFVQVKDYLGIETIFVLGSRHIYIASHNFGSDIVNNKIHDVYQDILLTFKFSDNKVISYNEDLKVIHEKNKDGESLKLVLGDEETLIKSLKFSEIKVSDPEFAFKDIKFVEDGKYIEFVENGWPTIKFLYDINTSKIIPVTGEDYGFTGDGEYFYNCNGTGMFPGFFYVYDDELNIVYDAYSDNSLKLIRSIGSEEDEDMRTVYFCRGYDSEKEVYNFDIAKFNDESVLGQKYYFKKNNEADTTDKKSFKLDSMGVEILFPNEYSMEKSNEENRRGSFDSYDFLNSKNLPYLDELQLFSEESISNCNQKDLCFFGDFPNLDRYSGQKKAFFNLEDYTEVYSDLNRKGKHFELKKFNDRYFFVSSIYNEKIDDACIFEYTTFIDDTKIDIWITVTDEDYMEESNEVFSKLILIN